MPWVVLVAWADHVEQTLHDAVLRRSSHTAKKSSKQPPLVFVCLFVCLFAEHFLFSGTTSMLVLEPKRIFSVSKWPGDGSVSEFSKSFLRQGATGQVSQSPPHLPSTKPKIRRGDKQFSDDDVQPT